MYRDKLACHTSLSTGVFLLCDNVVAPLYVATPLNVAISKLCTTTGIMSILTLYVWCDLTTSYLLARKGFDVMSKILVEIKVIFAGIINRRPLRRRNNVTLQLYSFCSDKKPQVPHRALFQAQMRTWIDQLSVI
jgi:hypothetical protein